MSNEEIFVMFLVHNDLYHEFIERAKEEKDTTNFAGINGSTFTWNVILTAFDWNMFEVENYKWSKLHRKWRDLYIKFDLKGNIDLSKLEEIYNART